MKKLVLLKLCILIAFLMAVSLYGETAKEPETIRGKCDEGTVEETFWFTHTDTDGDGKWDWISGKKCDGTFENRPLDENGFSLGRTINGQTTNIISGDIVNGSSFVIEIVDISNNAVAYLNYDFPTQSYSLNWLAPLPQASYNSNNYKDNNGNKSKLSEEDLILINKMKNIYLGRTMDFDIFPNPSSKIIKIKSINLQPKIYNIVISSIEGITLINEMIDLKANEIPEINISNLKNGVYIISIYTDNKTISKKFIIE